jgi:hypothetical protein
MAHILGTISHSYVKVGIKAAVAAINKTPPAMQAENFASL